MLSIPRIGLLLPYHRRANLGRIPYPKLVSQRGQHPLEPLRVPSCFHAHAHWLLQLSVKLLRLTVAVVESAFDEFASFRVHHRNLLEARMKITPYNQHTRLLSFRVLVSLRCQVYSASGEEPTLLSNQLCSLTAAKAVCSTASPDTWDVRNSLCGRRLCSLAAE